MNVPQEETARAVRWQEEIGLDVLVHGEFERNDMVQYFGEQLPASPSPSTAGCNPMARATSGRRSSSAMSSRPQADDGRVVAICAVADQKADEGHADRARDHPQLVIRARRHPRSEACRQIALAIRDEVIDLEKAGAAMIQIDEAALREGLPLRKARMEGLSRLGGGKLPPPSSGVARRDANPHPHVLFGVQRHHRCNRGDGCRRDLDRDVALEDGIARCLCRVYYPTRSVRASTTSIRRASRRR